MTPGILVVLAAVFVAGLALLRLVLRAPVPARLSRVRCPDCGEEQRADLSRVAWLTCPRCDYVILNGGGKTGPAPAWRQPRAMQSSGLDDGAPVSSTRKAGPR
jgi:ribosomal protein S27E